MRAFVEAADTGSFAAAGRRLNLSPQMIGKQVAELEAELGVVLLARTTRRQSLTEAGTRFLDHCRAVLTAVKSARESVASTTNEPRGTLRLAAPPTYGANVLSPLVARYLARFREVSVDLVLTDRLIDLIGEGFDGMVRIEHTLAQLPGVALPTQPLPPYSLIACAAPGYLSTYGAPGHPSELHLHQCLSASLGRESTSHWPFVIDRRLVDVQIYRRLIVNDATAILNAARAGLGIAMLPSYVVANDVAAGALTTVLTAYQSPTRATFLHYTPIKPQPPKLREFLRLLQVEV